MAATPTTVRRWRALGVALLLAGMSAVGCRCGSEDIATPAAPLDELVRRRVPDCDMIIGLPKGWIIDMPDPGPLPAPPPAGTPIQLDTRTLVVARPGTPAPGMLVPPTLQVLQDAWLPVGTTGVDYLVAQRGANQAVIGENIRHVDAEPSRREGRPTYHIRDEWTVHAGDASRDVSQEALLILDNAITPAGDAGVHGFTVVITMEKAEFQTMQPMVRQILASVTFERRANAAPQVVPTTTPLTAPPSTPPSIPPPPTSDPATPAAAPAP